MWQSQDYEKLTAQIGGRPVLGTLICFVAPGDLRITTLKCNDLHRVSEAVPLRLAYSWLTGKEQFKNE